MPLPFSPATLLRHSSGWRPVRTAATSSSAGATLQQQQGRVYLVTGSTDGIGLHTATKLAQAGATVLVHGRSKERVDRAVASICKAAGNSSSSSSVKGYTADLSSLADVRQLAAAVQADHPQLYALVNNAGVYETQKKLSADGFENTWAVNVLAPFLLTSLLWQSVQGRIVNTASISAASHIDMANLQQERGYSAHDAYSLSKLCNIIFTLKLAELLQQQGSSVTANTLDPGTVNTKMLLAGWGRIGIDIGSANNTFKLLTDPNVADITGGYFISHRKSSPPSIAEDPLVQQQLWQLWQQQTGASYI
ncbi:hypothetical protein OEZ85_000229 [Tetradesmus obliquus]|uniref:Uncharacterized protein n=1 Tax=Tetradesmus obliquus TaxID=3088 RepID=A0ABY8UPK4_TETOB|nr:hypothetical protein OEZ85_000229 [Tetradesmus obliquus]